MTTSVTRQWHTVTTVLQWADIAEGTSEIHVEAQAATAGGNLDLEGIRIRPRRERAALEQGPYSCEFLPAWMPWYEDENEPLSVEAMTRLVVDLLDLRRRRRPGMICATWHRIPVLWITVPDSTVVECIARQHRGVTSASVWVYLENVGTAGFVNVKFDNGEEIAGESVAASDLTEGWGKIRVEIPPTPSGVVFTDWAFSVNVGTQNTIAIHGCCAWFDPIAEGYL